MTLTSLMVLNTYWAQYACLMNKPQSKGKAVRSIRMTGFAPGVGGSQGETGLSSEGLVRNGSVKCVGT